MSVFEVDWVHRESIHGEAGILEPHGRAVKVDQHPLVRVEVEAVGHLDPVKERPELRADERTARVRGVNMKPQALCN